MMNREDLAKLYEKANGWNPAAFLNTMDDLERFAALVEAHVNAKEKERQRYDIHSCGPDCDRYICVAVRKARQEERNRVWTQEHWTEYERSIAATEREAWPNLEPVINWLENGCNPKDAAAELRLYDAAIRARGNK